MTALDREIAWIEYPARHAVANVRRWLRKRLKLALAVPVHSDAKKRVEPTETQKAVPSKPKAKPVERIKTAEVIARGKSIYNRMLAGMDAYQIAEADKISRRGVYQQLARAGLGVPVRFKCIGCGVSVKYDNSRCKPCKKAHDLIRFREDYHRKAAAKRAAKISLAPKTGEA